MIASMFLPSLAAIQVVSASETTIEEGDTGNHVAELKANLMRLGFDSIDLSQDAYDEQTKEMVSAFQEHFGLEVKGYATSDTLNQINELLEVPLQRGHRHERTVILKQMLYTLGYWDSPSGTTLYGSETEEAVKAFQKAQNLPVSGIVDDVTWKEIELLANGPLRNPMYREDAVWVKAQLAHTGFGSFSMTNYYGPQTETAVKEFQSYFGINADGIVGAETISKMESLENTPFQRGEHHEETVTLKELLRVYGYWNSPSGTTLYGSQTEAAVRDFQMANGLHPSGIADDITWTKLKGIASQPLRNPMYRQDAIDVKIMLETLGFGSFSKTDYYGPQTEAAVKKFQNYFGLSADGIVGNQTLTKLKSESNTRLKSGYRDQKTVTLKNNLYILGYWNSKTGTTLYGSQTARAVSEFQKDNKLVVSGVADSITLKRLNDLASGNLRYPMYRDDVVQLKIDLEQAGFGSFSKTNYYGPQTEEAVRAFQRANQLSVTGVVDANTIAKLKSVLETPYRLGEHSDETALLKEKLYVLGYWSSPTGTTLFGPQTESAVKAFQKDSGLAVTGIPNPSTLALLKDIVTGPLQNPMYREDTIEVKTQLETLGFGTFVKNNYFGPMTESALKTMQSYYGIPVTGKVDQQTKRTLTELLSSNYQLNKTHASIETLKLNLRKLGFFDVGTINRTYDQATKNAVEQFQQHYDLRVNGIVDPMTESKMDSILKSPYQRGNDSNAIRTYKQMLIAIGYGDGLSSQSGTFGSQTENQVKAFQAAVGLPVSGILDDISIDTLTRLYERRPVYRQTYYPVTLSQQLDVQMGLNPPPQTDRYSRSAAFVRTADLSISTGGTITGDGVRLRTEPNTSSDIKHTVSRGTTFVFKKEVKGSSVSGSTTWYEIEFSGNTVYVHSSLANKSSTVAKTSRATNVHESQSSSSHVFYRLGTNASVSIVNQGTTWTEIQGSVWRNAKRSEVIPFLDPSQQDEFQHLLLTESVNVPAAELDKLLAGKGVLNGLGQAFMDASNTHSVNEIYLISHALLETGHGQSALATGIRVGRDRNGSPQVVTSSNQSQLTDIKTVHNLFGIGAVDSDPHRLGAIRAYNEGWTTPRLAVIGGAKFIGERYVHNANNQNTLYKMRWNPDNPGHRQYATDMGWAAKQVSTIKSFYNQLVAPQLVFDIPVYR